MDNWQTMTADERVFAAQLIAIQAEQAKASAKLREQLRKVGI